MTDFIYKDHIPANARILIDYKAKEKVKFAYPIKWTYKKALDTLVKPTVVGWWIWFNFQVGMTLAFLYLLFNIFDIIRKLYGNGIHYHIASISSINPSANISFTGWISIGVVIEIILVPNILMLWIRKNPEWLSMNFPKINAWISKVHSETKRITFHSKDINRKKLIIPVFENVFLDYKCYGDFGKSLAKIEIFEYPFSYFYKTGKLFWFMPKGKTEKVKNDTLFRAVFHFNKIPKEGRMDVVFI